MTTTQSRELAATQAAHAREERRLEAARAELDRLTEEVDSTDPDSVDFGRAVAARDASAARVEALQRRAERARQALEDSREQAAGADRAAAMAELAKIQRAIARHETAILDAARELRETIAARSTELGPLVAHANELYLALNKSRPVNPWSAWSGISRDAALVMAAKLIR